MAKYTREEKQEILLAAMAARKRGDWEEADRISNKLPMAPHLAMSYFTSYGKEALFEAGFDLSEANEAFGEGWYNQPITPMFPNPHNRT